jgi:hypothetical protein
LQLACVEAAVATPSEDTIAHYLFSAAEARVWLHNLTFDHKVSDHMKQMAWRGASNILSRTKEKQELVAERYARVATRVGSEAIVVFVDEMALSHIASPDYIQHHVPEIPERIWVKVRDLLCPIWPIC